MRVLIVKAGQSNLQGNATLLPGVGKDKAVSRFYGTSEPYPLCNNTTQGGGPTPYLLDRLWRLGAQADVIDGSIGSASAFLFTGRAGWVLTGTASDPAALGYSSTVSYTGSGTAAVLREGDVGFDPCGLLSRLRAAISARLLRTQYDAVWFLWSNGESDTSYGSAPSYGYYRDALLSVTDYVLASGCTRAFIGLSIKTAGATTAQMGFLQQAVAEAVAARAACTAGADLYALFGENPPAVPEAPPNGATRVHLSLRGQERHAQAWAAVLGPYVVAPLN